MKTIIAGSRNCTDKELVYRTIKESGFNITEVVSGNARGVDKIGEEWAFENHIPLKTFPAQWKEFGKAAGSIRNGEMAHYADALIAIIYPESRGTRNMIEHARKLKLKIYSVEIISKDVAQYRWENM